MRWLALVFAVLIVALQYPMWLGKGGWLQVREYDRQLAEQREQNAKLKLRNDALDADVRDLKTGYEAVEERARNELGMIRQDEVFFQLQPAGSAPRVPATKPAAGAKPQPATAGGKPPAATTGAKSQVATSAAKPEAPASAAKPEAAAATDKH